MPSWVMQFVIFAASSTTRESLTDGLNLRTVVASAASETEMHVACEYISPQRT
jgi:hypothetical protein